MKKKINSILTTIKNLTWKFLQVLISKQFRFYLKFILVVALYFCIWFCGIKPYFYAEIENIRLNSSDQSSIKLIDFIETTDLHVVDEIFDWRALNKYTLTVTSPDQFFLCANVKFINSSADMFNTTSTSNTVCLPVNGVDFLTYKYKSYPNLSKNEILPFVENMQINHAPDSSVSIKIEPSNKKILYGVFIFFATGLMALFLKSIKEILNFIKKSWLM